MQTNIEIEFFAEQKEVKIKNVSSFQTLHDLKLLICQEIELAPFQQNLYLDEKVLENDELTLAQCGITPRSIVYLEKREENSSYLEDFVPPPQDKEEGFQGDFLLVLPFLTFVFQRNRTVFFVS